VLLHGFTGSGAAFDHLEPLLGSALRAVAIDLPGHAGSPAAGPAGAGWTATVDAVAAAIVRAHGGPAHLVGYSMGARIALAVALRYPRLLRSLVLESGTAGLRRAAERDERRAQDGALADSIERDGVAAFVDRWEQTDVLASQSRLPPELGAALRARRLAQSAAGLAWALRELGQGAQPDLWPELRKLDVRALLLYGSRDDKYRSCAERLALKLPHATLHEIRGAGHSPHLERPQLFAAALTDFISAVPADPPAPRELSTSEALPRSTP
jgi:2-succinyl-6-hydroxy-2,4-cyclohexadiene-1-carboxylate synthase